MCLDFICHSPCDSLWESCIKTNLLNKAEMDLEVRLKMFYGSKILFEGGMEGKKFFRYLQLNALHNLSALN